MEKEQDTADKSKLSTAAAESDESSKHLYAELDSRQELSPPVAQQGKVKLQEPLNPAIDNTAGMSEDVAGILKSPSKPQAEPFDLHAFPAAGDVLVTPREKIESEDKAVLDLGTKLAEQISKVAENTKTGAEWTSSAQDLVDGNLRPDYYLKAWAQVHVDSVTGVAQAESAKPRDGSDNTLEKQLQRVLRIDQMNLTWSEGNDASWPLEFKLQNNNQEVKLSIIAHLSRVHI